MRRPETVQCPILLGRDDLLELFDRLTSEALESRGQALFLSGQAGLGKTRLIRAAVRKAEAAGFRVEGGAVAPQDREVPLASIREMAASMRGNEAFGSLSEDLLGIDGPHHGDPLGAHHGDALGAHHGDALGAYHGDALGAHHGDALGARRLIVRSTADRILAAVDRPTMLVFDDLHWTDEMSLEVVGELARHAAGRPLLLVGGYRADEFPADTIHREWRARLLGQRYAEEVRLRPLTVHETAVATTLILGSELPAPRDVLEAIHERTNGIPLHIEELLAALDDDDRADGRRIREAHVPDTIGDAVLARVGRLSHDARTVARAGAVIGRCFSPDVLAGILDRPLGELEPTLDELVGASILYPFHYIDHGYFDFRHQLLRDAIYGSVPPSELRRFHAQAAEFVMTLEASSIVHASRHYERAGLRPQAFRASLDAAREASRISARQEAYELYRRAIANMPDDLPLAEQAELYESFSDAAGAIERNEECVTAARRARDLYLAAGQPLQAAGMLLGMSTDAARNGTSTEEMLAYIERGLDEIGGLPVTPEREQLCAWLLVARAGYRFFGSDLAGARADAEAARALAESFGNRECVLENDLLLARIDIVDGRYESGLSDGMRAAREARDAGFESVGVTGYRNLAILATRIMDTRAAELALREGLQYADAIEQSHCRQMMGTTRAFLDWGGARWDAADARARQELVDRGCRRGATGALDVIGLVALGRGRTDEARRWLDESLAAGQHIGEVQLILTPLWGLAETDLAIGDPAAAVARTHEAWTIATSAGERALFVPFVVTGARARIAARRPDEAERWVARAHEYLAGWESIAGPALSHADGLVRLAGGSLLAAREALERAVRGWEERGRSWETMAASLDLAQCLIRANRFAEAADVVAAVRERASAVGSVHVLARAEQLARAGRGRVVQDEPWRPLTVREYEVARLIAGGLTNAEIAAELSVSPRTVSAHVEHVLAKLGAARRAEIASWVASVASKASPVPMRHPVGGQDPPEAAAVH